MEVTGPVILPSKGVQRIAREIGIGDENADCLERVMVRRGLIRIVNEELT